MNLASRLAAFVFAIAIVLLPGPVGAQKDKPAEKPAATGAIFCASFARRDDAR